MTTIRLSHDAAERIAVDDLARLAASRGCVLRVSFVGEIIIDVLAESPAIETGDVATVATDPRAN